MHLQPDEAALLKAAAARAGKTRHDLARDRLLGRASEDTPLLACLTSLLGLHHRLEGMDELDDQTRTDILSAVRNLTAAARAEVAK
ncbi:hypothetical protein C725_2684 [Pacificimonas flava]|uniref:Uncharacterized protein n=1 Tax=Pacificimonas flava TaxID=1234595 RepID=M2S955_9SPHN|nr:hypothetical protein C725_2684 [Pacificimonas flava]